MVRYEIDLAVFDIATAKQHLIAVDPQARFAISRFPEAERLLELPKSRTANKAGR
jgi:hypothetical protein